ncbi:sarcoglycan alpha/epsilon [Ancylostoma ceylanicum]|uniref:Sarcoglycan alpha/epsilon n=1 Tax=Ancylostoma ceylanicum TaxID=53326 RepID=A0A0D6M1T2_9BILA|nr:sarcoglycan alpha/epsilon [Ancylostoma ceylanicum]
MESRNLATFPESVRTTSKTPPTWKPFPRIANRRLWTTKDMVAGTTAIDTRQTDARKGHLFVYTLHSAAFFPTAVDVAWSATLKNRPALPSWLHLVPSRYKAIAYLVGTPVTGARQVTVHVFAKRLDTFETKQQYIVISLAEDERYTRATQQIIDIHATNVETENLLSDRTGLIGQLEKSVREAFRGKDVNPYIYTVQPEFLVPQGKEHLFRNQRSSSLISIGSQRGFYPTVHKLIHNLQTNPSFCKKQRLVVLNKYFSPTFDIDWCRTRIRNVTMLHDFVEGDVRSEQHYDLGLVADLQVTATPAQPIREIGAISDGYSFWESVLVFPLIAVFCIVLVLVLSLIFFGRREGQQWRDYKTPKEQLDEYVSVRQSQRHLRELSVQRQLLLMASDRDHSSPPYVGFFNGIMVRYFKGVQSFLQPKYKSLVNGVDSVGRFSKSASKLNDNMDEVTDLLSGGSETIPVGKQTVAEAARQCGSSLHLYRNPLESETDEENENDSLDEKDVTGA